MVEARTYSRLYHGEYIKALIYSPWIYPRRVQEMLFVLPYSHESSSPPNNHKRCLCYNILQVINTIHSVYLFIALSISRIYIIHYTYLLIYYYLLKFILKLIEQAHKYPLHYQQYKKHVTRTDTATCIIMKPFPEIVFLPKPSN